MKPKDWFMLGVKLYALAYVVEGGFSVDHNAHLIHCTRPDKQKGRASLFDDEIFQLPFSDGEFVNMGYLMGKGLCRNLDKVPTKKDNVARYGDAVFG